MIKKQNILEQQRLMEGGEKPHLTKPPKPEEVTPTKEDIATALFKRKQSKLIMQKRRAKKEQALISPDINVTDKGKRQI